MEDYVGILLPLSLAFCKQSAQILGKHYTSRNLRHKSNLHDNDDSFAAKLPQLFIFQACLAFANPS